MDCRVSIIIPVYRRAEELGRLLLSLDGQVVPPLEIIVVDDTEDDSVRIVCESKAQGHTGKEAPLQYVRNPGPRSAAGARNQGARLGRGGILLFLDSDVELAPDYTKEIEAAYRDLPDAIGVQGLITNWAESPLASKFLGQHGHPGSTRYKIASGLTRGLLGATVPSANSCRLFEYPVILDRTVECSWLSGSNLSVRRSAFGAIGFEELEGYSLGEDVLLSRRLSSMGRLYMTPKARCRHEQAATGSPQRSRLGNAERTFFHRLLGIRGDIIYFNRRVFFPLLGYS